MQSSTHQSALAAAPAWQRQRATLLHQEFTRLHASLHAEGLTLTASLQSLAARLDRLPLAGGGKTLRISYGTIRRAWDTWLAGGRSSSALLHHYQPPAHTRKTPDLLIREIHRLATAPTGGRDKHHNGPEAAAIRKSLVKRWRAGQPIPGLGTWSEWWTSRHPDLPLPPHAPDFPISAKTVTRHLPKKSLRLLGNLGTSAANAELPVIRLDYSKLRKCELYTLDDLRFDVAAIDDTTGRVVEVVAYLLMEVASRSIVAFVFKPLHAIRAEDVDELLAHGLQVEGYGIGVGYTTYIKFERGTVACTPAAQAVLEGATDGRIKVLRTGMDGGVHFTGAPAEKRRGHSWGKAVIESFNRNLHRRLTELPGQRGNCYANEPQSLDFTARGAANPLLVQSDTLTAEAERLAALTLTAAKAGVPAAIKLPLLLVSQFRDAVRLAIHDHNTDPGHQMQGFHRFTEAEIQPGDWRRLDLPPTQS